MHLDLPRLHDTYHNSVNEHSSFLLDVLVNLAHGLNTSSTFSGHLDSIGLWDDIVEHTIAFECPVELQLFVGIVELWNLRLALGNQFGLWVAELEHALIEILVAELTLLLGLGDSQFVRVIEEAQNCGLEAVNFELILLLQIGGLQLQVSVIVNVGDLPVLELVNIEAGELALQRHQPCRDLTDWSFLERPVTTSEDLSAILDIVDTV